jgi:hypothetical protein
MTTTKTARIALAPTVAVLVALSTLALAKQALAADGPDPVVLTSKSQLPADCVSLGEISEERMMATSPDPARVQADAVKSARKKGATHLVTESLMHCGAYSYCYEGVAYRCPGTGGASSEK